MKSAYSTTSLPTSTITNQACSTVDHVYSKEPHSQKPTKFIWKEPPGTTTFSSSDKVEELQNKDVVVRNKSGGPIHKRKDLHHNRRHTLQGGVDFSMVSDTIKESKFYPDTTSLL